jgi:hypothetical protein
MSDVEFLTCNLRLFQTYPNKKSDIHNPTSEINNKSLFLLNKFHE